jgi:hypothetical protein
VRLEEEKERERGREQRERVVLGSGVSRLAYKLERAQSPNMITSASLEDDRSQSKKMRAATR